MSTPVDGAGSGSPSTDVAWHQGAEGWQPLSQAFIDRELGKPDPDYRSLADKLAPYSPAERHAGWIGIAQFAPSRMARTRAYIEALHNDPDPTSVAWSWLDGDFDLMERVEHVLSPDDEHTPTTVEALRKRVGSILDATTGSTAADEAWAQLTADPAATAPARPAPVQSPLAAPVAAAPQAPRSDSPAHWSPTHYVPAGGAAAWDYPDPSRPPRVVLNGGLGLVIDGIAGDWALVRAVNGWRGWVDGRRLTTRPPIR